MASSTLVDADVEQGRRFVQLLDKVGVQVKGAFWLYYPDADHWKLNIVTAEAEHGTRELYVKAIDAGAEIDLSKVAFVPPAAPVFKALSGLVKNEGGATIRFSQVTFNGVYVDDAVVYRLVA
jgi:hypothetical protein